MEKEPHIDDEEMPHIVNPELEVAWRGLVISMRLGGLPRDEAVKMLIEWDKESNKG